MRLQSYVAASAILAFSAMSISAQEASYQLTPAPGEYATLPTEFVLTVDGPVTVKKNIVGGNALLLTSPVTKKTQQLTGTYSGNKVTCKLSSTSTFPLDEPGDYIVSIRKGSLDLTWADDSKTTSQPAVAIEFVYNVTGNGGGGGEEETGVKYDILMNKTIPSLTPLDLDSKTIEMLQIYFDKPNLQLDESADAMVTITGPNYKQQSKLRMNMNMSTATVFKAAFPDPEYDGDYVLTIPQGVLGDEAWIKDHNTGHANAAVEYKFTVVGGKDPSTITTDLTFNPVVNPAVGSKVTNLDNIILTFESTPYWDETKTLSVSIKEDPAALAGSAYGNATVAKGEGNSLKLTITPAPTVRAEYIVTLPEGYFWNEEHEDDEDAGSLNGAMTLNWQFVPEVKSVSVTKHVPATDAYVAAFKVNEPGIILTTSDNNAVAKMKIEVTEYELDNDNAWPETIIDETVDTLDEEGNICWINKTGADIELSSKCYYEVAYSLYNTSNNVIADGYWEFYGDAQTGIMTIDADNNVMIFNLQGIKVNADKTALPAGLYIINGKKTVIR